MKWSLKATRFSKLATFTRFMRNIRLNYQKTQFCHQNQSKSGKLITWIDASSVVRQVSACWNEFFKLTVGSMLGISLAIKTTMLATIPTTTEVRTKPTIISPSKDRIIVGSTMTKTEVVKSALTKTSSKVRIETAISSETTLQHLATIQVSNSNKKDTMSASTSRTRDSALTTTIKAEVSSIKEAIKISNKPSIKEHKANSSNRISSLMPSTEVATLNSSQGCLQTHT